MAQSRCYYAIQISLISAQSGTTRRLDAAWRDGHRYQKAGVILGDFFSQGVAQLNLFDENAPRANSAALMLLMDKLHQQGWGTLYFAGQGIQPVWQMKRESCRRTIRLGVALTRCGYDVSRLKLVQCWYHPKTEGHVLRAEELAKALKRTAIPGVFGAVKSQH